MNKLVVLVSILVMAAAYAGTFSASRHGYGYMGYGGTNHGPSFFYWGGAHTYPSVRHGSYGGPSVRGHGLHGGK